MQDVASHPVGQPLSQELTPESKVVQRKWRGVPTAMRQQLVFTEPCLCALPSKQQGWGSEEFESSFNKPRPELWADTHCPTSRGKLFH